MMKPYEQRFPWNLDWNLLRTFMVVVDRRGITRAADFLGVTQPTISSALKRLEDTVGKRLVDRRPSHFAVTEAGQILYRECSTMFGSVSQIPSLMTEAESRISGHISIVMTSHVVSPHFDETLERFNEVHPDATYSISVAESLEVLNRLRQNRATMGLCLMREPDPALKASVLFREYFGLYCGPHHRLFGKERIKISELQGESSVSFQTDVESGPLYSVTQLREMALLKPDLKGISANLPEVRRMIIAGIGVGALPVHVAQKDVDLGQLWQLPPYSNLPAVDLYFLTNPMRSMNPAEMALVASINLLLKEVPMAKRIYD
ncbi:LysR family transcriptional regulator [Pseudohalocynthiibacter aestuariivivens]|nr:LysR family transcriptional regulator [Pseudohalocynthiibacter aestuariivivens]